MEVYPERQKRQKTRFVCNFNGKSVFRCTQRVITQRRVITLGPIFIKMVLNRAQGLKEKKSKSFSAKNNNRQRYNKKCRRGADSAPPPALLGLISHFHDTKNSKCHIVTMWWVFSDSITFFCYNFTCFAGHRHFWEVVFGSEETLLFCQPFKHRCTFGIRYPYTQEDTLVSIWFERLKVGAIRS